MRQHKSRPATDETPPAADPTPVARTAAWTNGSFLASKAVTVLIVLVFVAALFMSTAAFLRPQSVATVKDEAPAPLSSVEQSAGAYAVGFVGSWLSSTKQDSTALQAYVASPPPSLGERPVEYRNLATASIDRLPESPPAVQVLVSGELLHQDDPASEARWVPRFFEVTIDTSNDALAVAGFPAMIAGPSTGTISPDVLRTQLNMSSPAAQTVSLFLTAYLTGQGSTSPYLSPGVDIQPISPVPYRSLAVASALVSEEPDPQPADGATLSVRMVVTLQPSADQSLASAYLLDLTARAGRWEISRLVNAPVEDDPSSPTSHSTTTPTPSATSGR